MRRKFLKICSSMEAHSLSHRMVIESVQQFQEKEALIAALKIIALGEKDRLENKGLTADESRTHLRAARELRK